MQVEAPTFAQYDEPIPPGGATPPSPYDPVDAVYTAAHLLCANGAGAGPNGLHDAVWDYDHTTVYVETVLVQAAYRAVGVQLPRVAQTQYDAGPLLPPLTSPAPGDLVFFGTSATSVSHVGISIGAGAMIDAPRTGTVVRVQAVPTVPGARWGNEVVVGETRPWA